MSSFVETPRFPECLAYQSAGGPKFLTNVVALSSGKEQRNIVWSRVRCEYDVTHAAKTEDELHELQHFFMTVQGRAFGFRFKDFLDYECSRTQGILTPIGGSPTQWQMYKRYSWGAYYYDRKIVKPVSGTCAFYMAGSPDVWTPQSVDYTTGVVTDATVSEAATLTWAGQFDVPVRFDSDQMVASIIELNAYTWGQIKLVELKL